MWASLDTPPKRFQSFRPRSLGNHNEFLRRPQVKTFTIFILLTVLTIPAWAGPWPDTPPQIGRLELKQEYWEYIKEAARRYQLSPYLIQAVCAIESRYNPHAKSGRCYGLMQLHRDTAKKYGVDAHDPRENIMGGAAVLAHLMDKYHNNIHRVLHVYNASCTAAYEREVLRAYRQARQFDLSALSSEKCLD
jgi:soluble lytic murein transglycosylase-like protein